MSAELVTVAATADVVEAEYLRNQLESEGFEVFLADENVVGAYNLLAGAVGGVKIKVSSDAAREASEVIRCLRNPEIAFVGNGESNENALEADVDTGWGECQLCRSRDLTPVRAFVGWKWILVLFMIPAVRAKRKLVCNNCGFERVEQRKGWTNF